MTFTNRTDVRFGLVTALAVIPLAAAMLAGTTAIMGFVL